MKKHVETASNRAWSFSAYSRLTNGSPMSEVLPNNNIQNGKKKYN
jgi:hypothetical protein